MAAATSEVVDSSRRVLDDEGQWERLKAERLNTPARRTRVGMKAPPRTLGQAIVRHSHHKSMKKPQVSHKMPKLDLSSIAMVYGTASDALRDAAIRSLDLRTLSARMPGVPRPLSRARELPALTDRPFAPAAASAPPGMGVDPFTAAIALPPPAVERLPQHWAELCYAREEVVERLLNLAVRLQAYGHSGGGPPGGVNVVIAVAQGVAQLRSSSLAIIEAMIAWQGAQDAAKAADEAARMELEKRRKKIRLEAKQRAAATSKGTTLTTSRPAGVSPGLLLLFPEKGYKGDKPNAAAHKSAGLANLRPDLSNEPSNMFSSYALRRDGGVSEKRSDASHR